MELLWKPSEEVVREANVTRFIKFVNERHGLDLKDYWDLYKWSVEEIQAFWESMWDFVGIIGERFTKVVDDLNKFPGAKWFLGAKLNFC